MPIYKRNSFQHSDIPKDSTHTHRPHCSAHTHQRRWDQWLWSASVCKLEQELKCRSWGQWLASTISCSRPAVYLLSLSPGSTKDLTQATLPCQHFFSSQAALWQAGKQSKDDTWLNGREEATNLNWIFVSAGMTPITILSFHFRLNVKHWYSTIQYNTYNQKRELCFLCQEDIVWFFIIQSYCWHK